MSGLSSLIALVLLKQRCRNGAARTALPEMRQVGLESTKLAANVAKITILAASLANALANARMAS